eukprot:TRINITY_DN97841_c0_g1_i1.p1 TRINITY_DN97841_c0_g1~~TRINITY_DN97841_c0_g1_i1.p1  ORF type:complete len:123 (+),score=6.18 TRINITY_DN97841_c0_g1_i1:47-370(+)
MRVEHDAQDVQHVGNCEHAMQDDNQVPFQSFIQFRDQYFSPGVGITQIQKNNTQEKNNAALHVHNVQNVNTQYADNVHARNVKNDGTFYQENVQYADNVPKLGPERW